MLEDTNPRKIAFLILDKCNKDNFTLDFIIDKILDQHNDLDSRDRSFIFALVYGVLRQKLYLDWIIKSLSKISIYKIEPNVLNILRIGLYQIIFFDRVPISAAVNTSVELSKTYCSSWVSKYVNAVLRNASKNYKNVSLPNIRKDPALALSIKESIPRWLVRRWIKRFGIENTEKRSLAINKIPPLTIRTNTLKTTRAKLKNLLNKYIKKSDYTNYSLEGISLYDFKEELSALTEFKQGLFQVQDEAAQLVVMLLDPKPNEKILDACAGLGGKTGYIAQLINNTGKILAVDNNIKKLAQLENAMKRLGITNISTKNLDLLTNDYVNEKNIKFDKIFVDAPCSGLGVLRRNPDIKWKINNKTLKENFKKQLKILENVVDFLNPNGVIVYAVCSNELEENDEVITAFLNKHKDFMVDSNLDFMERKLPVNLFVNEKGYFSTINHLDEMDGFFAARLKNID